jgi:glycosyltransferase involved in cell wall biosynthesis
MDGIPVVLMEAMAMEVPVISTKLSGIPELVGQGAGIIVEPGDVNGLSDASHELANLSDRERREVGRRGRAIIESQFNLKTEVRKLAELFRRSSRRF